jgi:hypothetical protein
MVVMITIVPVIGTVIAVVVPVVTIIVMAVIATVVRVIAVVVPVIAAMLIARTRVAVMAVLMHDLSRHLPGEHIARDVLRERRSTDEQRGNESKGHWAFHLSSPGRIVIDPMWRQYRCPQLSGA